MFIAIPKPLDGKWKFPTVDPVVIAASRGQAKRVLIQMDVNWEDWEIIQVNFPTKKRDY